MAAVMDRSTAPGGVLESEGEQMAYTHGVREFLARLKHDPGVSAASVHITFVHRGGDAGERSLSLPRQEIVVASEGLLGPRGAFVPFHRIVRVRCGELEWARGGEVPSEARASGPVSPVALSAAPAVDGVQLDRECWRVLGEYQALLEKWNARYNLVSRRLVSAEVSRLISECLAALPLIGARGGALLDVGSGAGLPGLVLAIASPSLEVTLLEPRIRRATFLNVAIRELGLCNCIVEKRRVDTIAGRRFPFITLRGLDIHGCEKAVLAVLSESGLVVSYESAGSKPRERRGWLRLGEACIGGARAVALTTMGMDENQA